MNSLSYDDGLQFLRILLDRFGGEVTITDEEVVRVDRGTLEWEYDLLRCQYILRHRTRPKVIQGETVDPERPGYTGREVAECFPREQQNVGPIQPGPAGPGRSVRRQG